MGEVAAVLRPESYCPHQLPMKEAAGPSWEVVCGFGTEREQLDHLITDPGALAMTPHSSDQNLDDLGSRNNGIPEPRTSIPMILQTEQFCWKKCHCGEEEN